MTMDRSEKMPFSIHQTAADHVRAARHGQQGRPVYGRRHGAFGQRPFNSDLQTKQFDRLEQYAKLNSAPAVKFKDLEEVVTHKINVNLMPFDVRADFVRVTGDTVLVPITIQ